MKKKLSPAKPPLPKFQSDQEAAEYFESHSVASAWDQFPEAPQAKPLPALARQIRDRHARAKSPISLRLAPEQIAAGSVSRGQTLGQTANFRQTAPEIRCQSLSVPGLRRY